MYNTFSVCCNKIIRIVKHQKQFSPPEPHLYLKNLQHSQFETFAARRSPGSQGSRGPQIHCVALKLDTGF